MCALKLDFRYTSRFPRKTRRNNGFVQFPPRLASLFPCVGVSFLQGPCGRGGTGDIPMRAGATNGNHATAMRRQRKGGTNRGRAFNSRSEGLEWGKSNAPLQRFSVRCDIFPNAFIRTQKLGKRDKPTEVQSTDSGTRALIVRVLIGRSNKIHKWVEA